MLSGCGLFFQQIVREMDEKLQRTSGDSMDYRRLKASFDEKVSDYDKTKYELDVLNDQHSNLRKEVSFDSGNFLCNELRFSLRRMTCGRN
jgi:hypothetical protein